MEMENLKTVIAVTVAYLNASKDIKRLMREIAAVKGEPAAHEIIHQLLTADIASYNATTAEIVAHHTERDIHLGVWIGQSPPGKLTLVETIASAVRAVNSKPGAGKGGTPKTEKTVAVRLAGMFEEMSDSDFGLLSEFAGLELTGAG